MTELLRLAGDHFALMETMTTRDYLSFRDKLNPASGFQSAQLREIEILAGLPEEDRIPLGHEKSYMVMLRNHDGSPRARRSASSAARRHAHAARHHRRVALSHAHSGLDARSAPGDPARCARSSRRTAAPTRKSARERLGLALSSALNEAETRERLAARYESEIAGRAPSSRRRAARREPRARSRIRAALVFIESYRELPLLAWPSAVVDGLVAFEQSFVLFRQRHARMVERVIGRRTGTGGSAGVDYLDQTALRYRIFRDVWAVRTLLVQQSVLPPVEHPSSTVFGYAFAGPSK
jgi:tryptophan 2,3-dioxygenase